MKPCVLTIGGSDPSGGAGIQADIKTGQSFGVYTASVVTCLTAGNTRGVTGVFLQEIQTTREQLKAVLNDLSVDAIKIGMIANPHEISAIQTSITNVFDAPVVLDPVIHTNRGDQLVNQTVINNLRDLLFPIADLVTPNYWELATLADMEINQMSDLKSATEQLKRWGPESVVVTSVDQACSLKDSIDFVSGLQRDFYLKSPRHNTSETHGSGDAFSMAITCEMALGDPMVDALVTAKDFVFRAIENAPNIGHGRGPVNCSIPVYSSDSVRKNRGSVQLIQNPEGQVSG